MTKRAIIASMRWRKWRASAGGLALVGTLTACQLGPPPPLLSPLVSTGEYGYADLPLGDGRYQVSYTGPSQRVLRSPDMRRQTAEAERAQAFDLALWHAAQIALAQGFAGFRVSNVQTNVDSMADDYPEFIYGSGLYPNRPFGGPVFPFRGPYGGPSPYLYTQTQIVIDIALLHAPDAGDYAAEATIERMSKAYPGAAGPPQPAAG